MPQTRSDTQERRTKRKNADASHIIPGIWIGNEKSSQDKNFFETRKIQAVLNCTPEVQNKFAAEGVEYMRITLGDSRDPSDIKLMDDYLLHAASFIHKNHDIEGKNILIHCHQGIQRSVSCVTAYLMKHKGMSLKSAIKFLPTRRKQAFYEGTYLTFQEPLKKFESSVSQRT